MISLNHNNVRAFAAVVGACAAVGVGVLSLTVPQVADAPPAVAKMGSMTLGATAAATTTTPPTVEPTMMAVPAIKGPAPLPAEEKAAE